MPALSPNQRVFIWPSLPPAPSVPRTGPALCQQEPVLVFQGPAVQVSIPHTFVLHF